MRIQISQINERLSVRSIKPQGIERLKTKISEVGYLPEKPVLIAPNGDSETYILIDGNHRIAALEELGETEVEALLDEKLATEVLRLRRARLANEVSETIVPTTFVDDAELVWRLADSGMTQTEIGSVLGWSRSKVNDYNRLHQIAPQAWTVIDATVQSIASITKNGNASPFDAIASLFNEGLLRNILPLAPVQQLELISDLAEGKIKKNQFIKQAEIYRTQNEIRAYVIEKCIGIPSEFLDRYLKEISQGGYDNDWQTEDKPKLQRFIQAIIDEWQQKSETRLILGDFEAEILTIDNGTVDLILTDIPYNISNQGKVTKQGSEIVNAAFDNEQDEWDSLPDNEYLDKVREWVSEWQRVIREGGAVVSFCDRVLISDMWRIFIENGLAPKGIIVWEKNNPTPAGEARRVLWSSVEFMIWGVKTGASYTFNDSSNWNRQNVIHAPICGGHERVKDNKGKTLHPTQKPLSVLTPLVEVFSNRGDLILDGFMGVGSTGEAAKSLGRKFIGIERNKNYHEAALKRIS